MQDKKKHGYLIAAACFMIQAVGIGTFVSYGVFFNSLIAEFHWSRAAISGASSLALFLSGLLAIGVGRLNDSYGPRLLMGTASIFFGAGLLLMSHVQEIWHLYLYYGIIFGIGLSGIDVIALTTTARWFSRSRGFMTGIVKVGTGAGQFSVTFITGLLIAAYGWRETSVILGYFSLVVLFLLAQVLKRDPENVTGAKIIITKEKKEGMKAGDALRTTQMWIICSVNFLLVFTLMIILVHIAPHSSDIGLSAIKSAGVLSTIGAVSMIGRFVCGIAIDRIGSKNVMVSCFFILISALLWLQIADSLWMLYFFASIYGLAHGGFFTAISPIVVETFGIAAHGALFGLVVFSGTTGGAIGPIIAGLMFDTLGSYTTVFWIITCLSCVGLSLMLMLKPIAVKPHTHDLPPPASLT